MCVCVFFFSIFLGGIFVWGVVPLFVFSFFWGGSHAIRVCRIRPSSTSGIAPKHVDCLQGSGRKEAVRTSMAICEVQAGNSPMFNVTSRQSHRVWRHSTLQPTRNGKLPNLEETQDIRTPPINCAQWRPSPCESQLVIACLKWGQRNLARHWPVLLASLPACAPCHRRFLCDLVHAGRLKSRCWKSIQLVNPSTSTLDNMH